MEPTTKDKIENLIKSASHLAYMEDKKLSQALRKINIAIATDSETLNRIVQAILKS